MLAISTMKMPANIYMGYLARWHLPHHDRLCFIDYGQFRALASVMNNCVVYGDDPGSRYEQFTSINTPPLPLLFDLTLYEMITI